MAMNISKDQKITISISTIVAIFGSLAATVAGVKPFIETALAGEIKEQIQPLTDAFQIILLQSIESKQNAITAMEFKRDMCAGAPGCWTLRDAQDLKAEQDALAAMRASLGKLLEKR